MQFRARIKKFFIKKSSPKKSKTSIEEEQKEQKKKQSFWRKLWQQILMFIIRALKRQRKFDDVSANLPVNNKEISDSDEHEKSSAKDISKQNNIDSITNTLQQYENFIKKDFTLIIKEANSFLRSLKARIVELFAQNAALSSIDDLTIDLTEITEVYIKSEVMMHKFLDNCHDYRRTLEDVKRHSSPEQKFNVVQTQLDKVMKQLKKGQEIADISQNKDYSYITACLEKKKSYAISR